MAQIPQTQRKLREARFFFGHVSKTGRSPQLEKEDFDFYLSAFLSAGRSVTFVLQKEQQSCPDYEAWYSSWSKTLTDDEQQFLAFMNKQRVNALHKLGADTKGDVEMMPLMQFELEFRPGSITWMMAGCDAPGVPPPEMGVMVHYFDGRKEKATETCKQYLALLEKLVEEFDRTFP